MLQLHAVCMLLFLKEYLKMSCIEQPNRTVFVHGMPAMSMPGASWVRGGSCRSRLALGLLCLQVLQHALNFLVVHIASLRNAR